MTPEQRQAPRRARCPNATALVTQCYALEWDLFDGDRRERAREVRKVAEVALEWGWDIPDVLMGFYRTEIAPKAGDKSWGLIS